MRKNLTPFFYFIFLCCYLFRRIWLLLVTGNAKKKKHPLHYSRVLYIDKNRWMIFFKKKLIIFFWTHGRIHFFGPLDEYKHGIYWTCEKFEHYENNMKWELTGSSKKVLPIYNIKHLQCENKVIHHSPHRLDVLYFVFSNLQVAGPILPLMVHGKDQFSFERGQ